MRIGLGSILFIALSSHADGGFRMSEGDAPRGPQQQASSWASGIKQGFGTSYEAYDPRGGYSDASPTAPLSRTWFTIAEGTVSEIYWPRIDQPQVRDSQFLIVDENGRLLQERTDLTHDVRWLRPGVPVFVTTSRDHDNRFSITRTVFTDPSSNTVLIQVHVERNVDGLRFYYLHNPSAENSPLADSASAVAGPDGGLYAWEGNAAQAVLFSIPLLRASAGFEAASDGFQDLAADGAMDFTFARALNGNVALTGWLDLPTARGTSDFVVAIGFGNTVERARAVAQQSLATSERARTDYILGWEDYQSHRRDLGAQSTDGGALYRASLALMKSSEDKTSPGAFIASPSVPWGLHREDASPPFGNEGPTGGYHLVWPRDLYQIATSLLEAGDGASARAALGFLARIQYTGRDRDWSYGHRNFRREGGFPQNVWVDGHAYWDGFQMDQTSYPVLLAYRLWRAHEIDLADFIPLVRRAGDFIQRVGPWTSQERWEENCGVSPSTLAAEIAALWTAGEMSAAVGDQTRAESFVATADHWSGRQGDNVEAWTFTTSGALGNGRYYERIEAASDADQTWNPNDNATFLIKNEGGQVVREKDVVDAGFLELARLGVRRANDPHLVDSLPEVDNNIRVDTPRGPGFFRYLGDRYGRDEANGQHTAGMLWPLLTGERGHYEFARALENGSNGDAVIASYITWMERFSSPWLTLPEQVWDAGSRMGASTGAATPLGWAHAEYVKLLASRAEGRVVDQIPSVMERTRFLSTLR